MTYKCPLNPNGYPHTVHLRNTNFSGREVEVFLREHMSGKWEAARFFLDPTLDSIKRGFPAGDVADEYYFENEADAIYFKMRFG